MKDSTYVRILVLRRHLYMYVSGARLWNSLRVKNYVWLIFLSIYSLDHAYCSINTMIEIS